MSDCAASHPGFSTGAPSTQDADTSNASAVQANDQVQPADGYAGDISPKLAWQWAQDEQAVIVDVRTDAEREWVGFVPGAFSLAWKQWPQMQPNPQFADGLQLFDSSTPLLMLCRSGIRSIAAARAATQWGFKAYNILEGFEGDPNSNGHRGAMGGWRFRGLPWSQN